MCLSTLTTMSTVSTHVKIRYRFQVLHLGFARFVFLLPVGVVRVEFVSSVREQTSASTPRGDVVCRSLTPLLTYPDGNDED